MPGYIPWLIDGEEARILINVLEQTLDVAARAAQNASLLEPPNENAYLIRIPERRGDVYAWKDELVEVLPPGPRSFPVPINHDLLEQMAKLPRRQKTSVELGFLPFPQPMESESGRPYLPLLFVGVDGRSGDVLFHELVSPEEGLPHPALKIPFQHLAG